jgi:hypothetical protein
MNKNKTLSEYLIQPITDAEKNKLIAIENKESKILYWLSLLLLGSLPFLNTLVETIQMKSGINLMKVSQLQMSISSLLIVNLLALAAYVIGMWSIKNVSKKIHPFAFTGLVFGIVFIMSLYQKSMITSSEILLFDIFVSKMFLLFGSVIIITMIYMAAVELIISYKVIESNNKNYRINKNTLSLSDGFDKSVLMSEASKELYQSIINSGRKPYKFEHDMIIDMNLKEYEVKLQVA